MHQSNNQSVPVVPAINNQPSNNPHDSSSALHHVAISNSKTTKSRTGYVFEQLYLWHDAGTITYGRRWVEPGEVWENPDTKRRFHNLVEASGYIDNLVKIKARYATEEEILTFHTKNYVDLIKAESLLRGGDTGESCQFGKGSYEIALLSAGGVLAGVEAIVRGDVNNCYCLVRPPGHHATANQGMGFCIFNNIVIGALRARSLGLHRIAIVDYDVHHGNGTQEAFWSDPDTLFISIHQDSNYPLKSGFSHETGAPTAPNTTVNIPLPPGSGVGAYYYAFETVVLPAIERFHPDIILVSSGFDGSYADPLAAMMLSSEAFGKLAAQLISIAERLCHGRCLFAHEGGYSKDYVPFCGLAVLESLTGIKSIVQDPSLNEVHTWGYQDLQFQQACVVDGVAERIGLMSTHIHDANIAKRLTLMMNGICKARGSQILNTASINVSKNDNI